MSDFKSVTQRMPEPYSEMEIDVRPAVDGTTGRLIGHGVGIMDKSQGQGTRSSMDYAEAKAKAVLKAIRAYRRKNAAALEEADRGN